MSENFTTNDPLNVMLLLKEETGTFKDNQWKNKEKDVYTYCADAWLNNVVII